MIKTYFKNGIIFDFYLGLPHIHFIVVVMLYYDLQGPPGEPGSKGLPGFKGEKGEGVS